MLIGVDARTPANIFKNLVLQCLALRIGNDHRPDLAAVPSPHPHDNGFLIAVLISDATLGVHIAGLASDVGLIDLHRIFGVAAEFSRPRLHHLADAVEHEPSRLLGDSDGTGHFVAGNPILAIGEHPEGSHPLVETDRAILENRPYLEGELLLAGVAVPNLPGLDEGMLLPTAPGARDNPIRPTEVEGVLESPVRIGK